MKESFSLLPVIEVVCWSDLHLKKKFAEIV